MTDPDLNDVPIKTSLPKGTWAWVVGLISIVATTALGYLGLVDPTTGAALVSALEALLVQLVP